MSAGADFIDHLAGQGHDAVIQNGNANNPLMPGRILESLLLTAAAGKLIRSFLLIRIQNVNGKIAAFLNAFPRVSRFIDTDQDKGRVN